MGMTYNVVVPTFLASGKITDFLCSILRFIIRLGHNFKIKLKAWAVEQTAAQIVCIKH